MTDKEKYCSFAESRKDLPIYMQPWWLDVVCSAGSWDVALAIDGEDNIIGALPYYLGKLKFFSAVMMPPLTPFIGPYLDQSKKGINTYKAHTREKKILDKLVSLLPQAAFFIQQYRPELSNWLPFHWQDYQQTTRYTYKFRRPISKDEVRANLKASCRSIIKKAETLVEVLPLDDIGIFYEINKKSYARQQLSTPYSFEIVKAIDEAATQRGQRTMWQAQDPEGNIHAVLYLLHDDTTIYNVMIGADTTLRNSGAVRLLIWRAIEKAAAENKEFDFEGSMNENIEKMFRSFSPERVPYFRITKTANRFYEMLRVLSKVY